MVEGFTWLLKEDEIAGAELPMRGIDRRCSRQGGAAGVAVLAGGEEDHGAASSYRGNPKLAERFKRGDLGTQSDASSWG